MSEAIREHGKPSIALIGMRGSGKSSVGAALAELLGGTHEDTDKRIAEQTGQSIAKIFQTIGEVGFRELERQIVLEVVKEPPAIISVGGGAVLDDRNVCDLRRVASLIWLTAPPNVLLTRIAADENSPQWRPPFTNLSPLEELETLSAARESIYATVADYTFDTVDETPQQLAHRITTTLQLHPG